MQRPELSFALTESHLLHRFLLSLRPDSDAIFDCRVDIGQNVDLQKASALAHELHCLPTECLDKGVDIAR